MKKYIIYVFVFMILFLESSIDVKADYDTLVEEASNKTCEALKDEGLLDDENENLLIDNASEYDANCIYTYTYNEKQCLIVQAAFDVEGDDYKIPVKKSIGLYNKSSNGVQAYYYSNESVNEKDITNEYFNSRAGACPAVVTYKSTNITDASVDKFVFGGKEGIKLELLLNKGEKFEIPAIIGDSKNEVTSCADALGEEGVELLKALKNIFMLVVPIILIVLASLDFVTAIFSSEEGNMKKCQSKFIKRLIIAVVIFLIPSLLQLLLGIASNIWPEIDATMCGIFSK